MLDNSLNFNIIQYLDKKSIILFYQTYKIEIDKNILWDYLFQSYYPRFKKEKTYLNFKKNYQLENIDLLHINNKYYDEFIKKNEWCQSLLNTNFININHRKDTYIHENVLEIMKCMYLTNNKLRNIQAKMKELYDYEKHEYYDLHNGYYYLIDELLNKSEELKNLITHYKKYNIIN